jgi:hypothetical protein
MLINWAKSEEEIKTPVSSLMLEIKIRAFSELQLEIDLNLVSKLISVNETISSLAVNSKKVFLSFIKDFIRFFNCKYNIKIFYYWHCIR